MSTTCRSCGAEIIWAKTVNGKTIPLNAKSSVSGNIFLQYESDPRDHPMAIVVPRGGGLSYQTALYTSHFTNCPQAGAHRKTK